ncbi:methyl-accepting chemotaxis protein [Vibrio tarriae]|uniref:Methyl-accepting chemotaxis protein n=1 Tax=Vibrio tarriae TaxID=2014742 RepID=A0AAU8WQS6_9VIBR|nr:methyl-accepting chemotaxis protein [Vibrio tarriae]ASK54186.1 methyl-accepting chemotaxis protein [Vibrio tarriae]RBM25963.1 methyl-accepting chemotaxis protein [Vibrio tarriae]RBM38783.1 methyl-accepting chemotaxis protein [Vibrio tarriae]RBM52380.1 methyl-accepting chemotaxis protein [Vibrio tarriae]RBM54027.1 methyl-accepting chemotaxis protein [Vibrio tarriae]
MKIQYKLTIPVVAILITFLAVSLVNLSQSRKQSEIADALNHKIYPVMMSLEDAYRDLYQTSDAAQGLLLARSADKVEYLKNEFKINTEKTVQRLAKVKTLLDSGLLAKEQSYSFNQLLDKTENWIELYRPMFEKPEQAEAYYRAHQQRIHDEFVVIRALLKEFSVSIDELLEELNSEYKTIEAFNDKVLFVGLLAVLLSATIAFWGIQRFVVKPIKSIEGAMADIAQGDGDLTRRLDMSSNDELGQLSAEFNHFVSRIHNTISEVVGVTVHLRHEMQHILKSTQQINSFASGQQQESDAVAAAVNEMQATSQSVSDSASQAAQSSQMADQQVEQTQQTVRHTVASIEHLSTEIQSATTVIHQLDHEVNNIASVLDVIRGIAEQTNLLALNAAIEAARAGEQGRGFAVVADEVRSLASRTQDSTGEIQTMIEKLQQGARQAVDVMSRSAESRNKTLENADKAQQSLQQIETSITHMNDMNIQIASASEQQSVVSAEVNLNIQNIADSSKQMVDMVRQARSACESLSNQCEHLDQLVGKFKV